MARAGKVTIEFIGLSSMRALLKQAYGALDTASGCLDLVAENRKPIDLEDCRDEIRAARNSVGGTLDRYETAHGTAHEPRNHE